MSIMDTSADWADPDESSIGEYLTADDGYEADIEIFVKNSQDITSRRINQLDGISDAIRGNVNAHPALCSLTINLLIYFAKQ